MLQIDQKFKKCQFFLTSFSFSCQVSYWSKFHVNIITGSGITTIFFYKGSEIEQKSGNRKYPRLSFAQDLETGASYGYQILHEWLLLNVIEYCKIPGLQLLPLLSY